MLQAKIKLSLNNLVDLQARQCLFENIRLKLSMKLKNELAGQELTQIQAYIVVVSVGFLLNAFGFDYQSNIAQFVVKMPGMANQPFKMFWVPSDVVEKVHKKWREIFSGLL